MLEALVITLREGMEAALVIGIILSYLRKTGQSGLRRFVYAGLTFAIAVSLAGGITFELVGIDPESEFVEGLLYFIAALLVLGLVIWMYRGRNVRLEIETRVSQTVSKKGWRQGFGLFLFTSFMVGREGIETVFFLAALTLSTTVGTTATVVMRAVGALLGLILATAFSVVFIRGGVQTNLRKFFNL